MTKIKDGVRLTFDDVLIEPNISGIKSRNDVDISQTLVMSRGKTLRMNIPVMSSCMDSVTEWEMAANMAVHGGLGIIHRNYSIREIESFKSSYTYRGISVPTAGYAVATGKEGQTRVKDLINLGVNIFCVDTANGQSTYAADMIRWIKDLYPDTIVIGGNVATAEGFNWLQYAGADMIRVGIGGGSFCTTRTTTGIGVPQLSSIMECAEVAQVPIIADGGIRKGADVAKALAAGAHAVMLGGLLAGTDESPGEIHEDANGRKYKVGRGMASREAQGDRLRSFAEGIQSNVPYRGSASELIFDLLRGLRSSMSYVGANDLKEFRDNATFIRITNAGLSESHPHILTY